MNVLNALHEVPDARPDQTVGRLYLATKTPAHIGTYALPGAVGDTAGLIRQRNGCQTWVVSSR